MHLDEVKTLFCKFKCPFTKGKYSSSRYIVPEKCQDCSWDNEDFHINMCKICPIDKFIQEVRDYGLIIKDKNEFIETFKNLSEEEMIELNRVIEGE